MIGGVSGQMARALSEAAGTHWDVHCSGRPDTDVTHPETIARTIDHVCPDVVICAAAHTAVDAAEADPEAAHAVNATGAGQVATACAARGAPLIHFSTDYVFDGSKTAPYVEGDAANPVNAYGWSKRAGEIAVLDAGGRAVILRLSWVYDAHSRNFLRTMLRISRTRDEIGVVQDQIGRPTYAPHAAAATLRVAERLVRSRDAPLGVHHLSGGGDASSWAVFAEEIFAHSRRRGGPSARVKPIPTTDYPTPAARPLNSMLDCSLITRNYGVASPDWRTGVAECMDHVASGGWRVD